jgi:hypothetical protein
MAKPLTAGALSLTQVYGSVAEELKRRIGDAQAAQAGPPVSEEIVPNTEQLQVDAWNARNPQATDEAMLALAQQKYQQHIASGMTPDVAQRATAEDLTHFRYDQRLTLYTHGQVDFSDQVKEAQRLAKLAARKTTPNPPMPPPTMPSAALTNLTTLGVQPSSGTAPPNQNVPELPGNLSGAAGLPETTTNGTPPPMPEGYPTLRSGEA